LLVPILLLLLTSCASTAAKPSASASTNAAGLAAGTLHDADAQLKSLLEAGLAPQATGKGRFIMGGIDQLPPSLQGSCPAGMTRDSVQLTLFSDPASRASAPAVVVALTRGGLGFEPWVTSPKQPQTRVAIARHGDFVIEVLRHAIVPTVDVVGWTPCLKGLPNANATMFPTSHGN
jgi:hypothetical protein